MSIESTGSQSDLRAIEFDEEVTRRAAATIIGSGVLGAYFTVKRLINGDTSEQGRGADLPGPAIADESDGVVEPVSSIESEP